MSSPLNRDDEAAALVAGLREVYGVEVRFLSDEKIVELFPMTVVGEGVGFLVEYPEGWTGVYVQDVEGDDRSRLLMGAAEALRQRADLPWHEWPDGCRTVEFGYGRPDAGDGPVLLEDGPSVEA